MATDGIKISAPEIPIITEPGGAEQLPLNAGNAKGKILLSKIKSWIIEAASLLYVPTYGDATINDVKTFTTSPQAPDGTTDSDLVNKGQIDVKYDKVQGTNDNITLFGTNDILKDSSKSISSIMDKVSEATEGNNAVFGTDGQVVEGDPVGSSGFDLTDINSIGTNSWDDATRTYSIAVKSGESSFWFWVKSIKITKTTTQSVVIPDVTESYYLYFDDAGVMQYVLESALTDIVFYEYAICGGVYWNATTGVGLPWEERHGKSMAPATHIYNHSTLGARFGNGLDPTGFVQGTTTYTNVLSGSFWDEDIYHAVALDTTHRFLYREGTNGDWVVTDASNEHGYKEIGDTYYSWNEYTGTTWQLTEGGSATDFYIMFWLAAPSLGGASVFKMVSQTAYRSGNNARAAIDSELTTIKTGGLPSPEFVFIYATVVKRTGELQYVEGTSVYYDLRSIKGSVSTAGGANDLLRISANDTTTDYGNTKIVGGSGITTAILNPSANEQLEISVPLAGAGIANGGVSNVAQTFEGKKTFANDVIVIDVDKTEITATPVYEFYYGVTPTKLGYVGYGSSGNNNIYLTNDAGGVYLRDSTGNVVFINNGNVSLLNTPSTDTANSPIIVRDATTGELKTQNNSYSALTAGASVAYDLFTGFNKTLSVAVDTTITFTNMASGMGGVIVLDVTAISDIIFAGSGVTFKGKGTFTDLAIGTHDIAYTWISSTLCHVNIGSTYDTL